MKNNKYYLYYFVIFFCVGAAAIPLLNYVYSLIANNDFVFTLSNVLRHAFEFAAFFTALDYILNYVKNKKK